MREDRRKSTTGATAGCSARGHQRRKILQGYCAEFKDKWVITEVIFETRGEGGYFVLPGSPLEVHSTGKPYRFIQGNLDSFPTLTPDERDLLFALAASFNKMPKEPENAKPNGQALSSGNDYNLRGDPAATLVKHGWILTHRDGSIEYYKRPGKTDEGHSASLHAIGHNNFYCFLTAAPPFEPERKYDAFGIYSRLEHNGDDKAAANQLAKDGYGSQATGNQTKAKPTNGDDKPKAPTHDVLRDLWRKSQPPIVYAMNEFKRYRDGLWKPIEESVVKGQMARVIEKTKSKGTHPTGGLLNSVYSLAIAVCSVPSERFNAQHQYLVCANGTLNVETRQLESHNPKHFCTSGVDYAYDPNAVAPTWMAYLESVCDAANEKASPARKYCAGIELIEFLQEFAGLALTTNNSHELAVWLVGDPGCGKSTFIEGLQAAMGDRTVEIGLTDIERSRFALGDLPGKTLAIATEQPGDFVRSTDLLIKLISGELVTVEKKFAHPYSFRSTVKMLWAMNDLPRIGNPNSGLFRRIKVAKWPKGQIEDPDPTIKTRIMTEGQGILIWSLDGLDRLRQRGYFCIPDEVQRASLDFRAANDIPAAFLADCCVVDTTGRSGFKAASGDLYKAYKQWCLDNGHKPKSSTALADDWRRLGLERSMSGGYPYWHGVELLQVTVTI